MSVSLALFTGPSLISRLIRWQTRGAYNHAALLFGDGLFVEAREFVGVRIFHTASPQTPNPRTETLRSIAQPGERVDLFPLPLAPGQEDALRWFCYQQEGRGYDYRAVAAFLTRTHLRTEHAAKWFCSELVYAACRAAGLELLRATEPWEVSPALLARSPLLPAKALSPQLSALSSKP